MSDPLGLTEDAILRVVLAVLRQELAQSPGRARADFMHWSRATRLNDTAGTCSLALDSLERLTIAGALNEMFDLAASGIEDNLLRARSIGDLVAVVLAGRQAGARRIGFLSSGSQGDPKPHIHDPESLLAEVAGIADLMPDFRIVLSGVPPQHIYGFIWTILLPLHRDVPVADVRDQAASRIGRSLGRNALVVSHPLHWRYLARSISDLRGATGVSSAGPLAADTEERLLGQGLGQLFEIYGSSETGGLGYRTAPDSAFRCLPHLTLGTGDGGEPVFTHRRAPGGGLVPPDHLRLSSDGSFRPAGRRDRSIKIGGVLVSPMAVEAKIRECPLLADCAIRPNGEGERVSLKLFAVPSTPITNEDVFRRDLDRWMAAALSAAEHPRRVTIGLEIPKGEMGKRADWDAGSGGLDHHD